MDTVFFVISKLLAAFLKVETWLLLLALVTFIAALRGHLRMARIVSGVLVFGMLGIGFVPVGDMLLRPLETEFASADGVTDVDGIVVLGGGEDVWASHYSGQPQLNAGGDRYLGALELAKAHPEARVLFAGGSARLRDLVETELSEAAIAEEIFAAQRIAPDRMLFENRSRNTAENATLSFALANPKAGDNWVLVTSAFHMPRAMRSFDEAGWDGIVPVPVDFRTRELRDAMGWNLQRNLGLTNTALREWVGRAAYSLTGR